jgi:hypothetical protein
VFLWDHGMQTFLWTSRDVYPFLYQFADAAWLWYSPGTRAPRWFFNVRTQQWQPQD